MNKPIFDKRMTSTVTIPVTQEQRDALDDISLYLDVPVTRFCRKAILDRIIAENKKRIQ